MSNYQGYLIKFRNQILDNKYFTDFSSTPNQRLEASAERDNTGYLQRSTLPNGKTKIAFSTHILHLEEKIRFQNIINNSMSDTIQRKCNVTYWNDETNDYSNADFYVSDIEYKIMDADDKDITYNPISVELIEY